MRLTPEQKQKLESHAIARKTSVTAIVEELINALPDSTEGIPVAKGVNTMKGLYVLAGVAEDSKNRHIVPHYLLADSPTEARDRVLSIMASQFPGCSYSATLTEPVPKERLRFIFNELAAHKVI